MLRFIVCTSLVYQCLAHLPAFPDPAKVYKPKHWKSQSEGIYLYKTPFVMYLQAKKGDKLQLSLSIPGHHEIPTGNLTLSITGPEAASIVCSPDWNGWNVEEDTRRRLSVNSRLIVNASSNQEKLEYEPFGVGYYKSLRSCNSTFPATGRYIVEVTSTNKDIRYSLGLGMAESWENFFNPLLPISLARVFHWSGRSWVSIIAPLVVYDVAVIIYCFYMQKTWLSLGSWLTLASVLSFLIQFSYILYENDNHTEATMWTTVILHLVVPTIICIYFFRRPRWWIKWVFALYLVIGVWQAYFIPQLIILYGLWIHGTNEMYNKVKKEEEEIMNNVDIYNDWNPQVSTV